MDTRTQTITLRRSGQFLQVSPPCDELRAVLRTAVHVPRRCGQAIAVGAEVGPLYRETTDLDVLVLECFMGLQPVVEQTLTASGYRVVKDFASPVPLGPGNLAAARQAGPCDMAFLDMIQVKERGLVRYLAPAVDPAWLIAQAALAWPALTIAVAVSKIGQARSLRRRLSRYLPNIVAITSRDSTPDEQVGRVVVATFNGLGHTGIEIEKRDVVIALDAVEASRPGPLSLLGYARRARMYGLLPLGQVARQDRDAIRLLSGFEEVMIHRHGVPATQIEVIRLHSAGGTEIPEQVKAAKVKRMGIWNNQGRNRRIARLAMQLRSDDRSELENYYPFFGEALKSRAQLAVLVLVENLDHGKTLAALLPDWPLIGAGEPQLTAQTTGGWAPQPSPQMPGDRGMQAIATWQGIPSLDTGGWDVVIRCDGGLGLPPLFDQTGAPFIYGINNPTDPTKARLLLVDFNDRQHQLLRLWSRQRWRAYLEHGWYPPGIDPVQARINQFIATRPVMGGIFENQGKQPAGAKVGSL